MLANLLFILFFIFLVGGAILSILKAIRGYFKQARNRTPAQEAHARYLQTPHWKAVSLAIRKKKGTCEVKGCTENRLWKLHTHHLHYLTKWHESDNDLKVLCGAKHHPATHKGVLLNLKDGTWLRPFDGKE